MDGEGDGEAACREEESRVQGGRFTFPAGLRLTLPEEGHQQSAGSW